MSHTDSALWIQEQIDELCKRKNTVRSELPLQKRGHRNLRSSQNNKKCEPDCSKTPIVRCLKCKVMRAVLPQHFARYEAEDWKHRFVCYKFKLKHVQCFKDCQPQARTAPQLINRRKRDHKLNVKLHNNIVAAPLAAG